MKSFYKKKNVFWTPSLNIFVKDPFKVISLGLWVPELSAFTKVIAFTKSLQLQTLPKAQRTRGMSSGYQSSFFRSYHKFSNKSRSDFIFILPTKQQLQNLNPISAFQLNLNFKILTKPSFRISTKNNLHNLSQGSAAKY